MSHLENRRKYESEGLKDAKESIVQTRWITKADVIWVRVRPEHTTDKERVAVEKHLLHLRDKIPIINDIAVFDHYDCKDQSFQLWKKHGIQCPDFITTNENSISENSEENILLVSNFIKNHGEFIASSLYVEYPTLTTSTKFSAFYCYNNRIIKNNRGSCSNNSSTKLRQF